MTPQHWAVVFGYLIILEAFAVALYVSYRNYRTFKADTKKQDAAQSAARLSQTHVLKIAPGIYVTSDGGERHKARIDGWHMNAWQWRVGDYLEIYLDGERSTRYRITSIGECRTSDRWFSLRCEFAPRASAAHVRAAMGMRQA